MTKSNDRNLECLPVLPSLDLDETEEFYTQKLGFGVIYKDQNYLIFRREELELHFWLASSRELCENTSVYIRGERIDELQAEFSKNNLEHLTELRVREWNMEEFYVHDPHGNLLRFGRIPATSDA